MSPRIAVLLDGSPLAEVALSYAVPLAQPAQGDLALLRVVAPPESPTFGSMAEAKESAQTYLMIIQHRLSKMAASAHLPPRRIHYRVATGPILSALKSAVEAEKPDMIVMTTHARSGLARRTLGSMATTIVNYVPVPVILMHPENPDPLPLYESRANPFGESNQPILVAFDGTPQSEAILDAAIRVAHLLQKPMIVLQVVVPSAASESYADSGGTLADTSLLVARQEAEIYLRTICERVAALNIRCTPIVRISSSAAGAIVEEARRHEAALIALVAHPHGQTGALSLGSVADAVLWQWHQPLLTVSPVAQPRKSVLTREVQHT